MGAPMQRVGLERWSGQCAHVAAPAGQAMEPPPHAVRTGAAEETGHAPPGRQSRSVTAGASGHHWTSGNAAANAMFAESRWP